MSKASDDASLFQVEEAVIAAARARLAPDAPPPGPSDFADLLQAYTKLCRSTRRMMRHADHNEAELNRLAHRLKVTNEELEAKNEALEGLSAKLSKYLSPQLYGSLFSGTQSATLAATRKELTVFFADIVDFTSLAETMEPEELVNLLNGYLTEMARIAIAHGATIDKYIGDEVMIFFGDPESRGAAADAQRCVAMAVEMLARLGEMRGAHDDAGRSYPIRVRIGIATGYCTVGNFGSEDRLDYTICGTPVNLAHRMQTHAAPDGILISEATYALLGDAFPTVEAGTIRLKGISRPVKAFEVLTPGMDDEERFVQVRDRGLQIFLDLDRLDAAAGEQALQALEEAKGRLQRRLSPSGGEAT